MTHYLQTLLEIEGSNPVFESGIKKLEKTVGDCGVDTKLISDILSKSHKTMRQLGLVVNDTTSEELYHALIATARRGEIEKLLEGTEYVIAQIDGQFVSLNKNDVIENAHHKLPFEKRIKTYAHKCLKDELITRYYFHNRTDGYTTCKIINGMGVFPETDEWYHKYKRKQKAGKNKGEVS